MEAAGHWIPGGSFQADVSDRCAQLHRFHVGPMQHAARDVGEQIGLAIALLDEHEFAAAHISDALGVIEFCALRAAAWSQSHRTEQDPGLADFNDRRAAIANDEQRIGVPVVGHS